MFVPLVNYSCYSLLEGLHEPANLVQRAIEAGYSSIGLTDHKFLTGSLPFYDTCLEKGLKPVIGLTLSVHVHTKIHPSPTGKLVFFAKNWAGWQSLCKLSSALLCEPNFIEMNSISFEILSQTAEHLICLTGGKNSLVFNNSKEQKFSETIKLLQRLREIFNEDLFIQITPDHIHLPKQLIKLQEAGKKLSLPFVAAPESIFHTSKDIYFQKIATALRTNTELDKVIQDSLPSTNCHFYSQSEIQFIYAKFPEALANTRLISDRCNLAFPSGNLNFPNLVEEVPELTDKTLRDKTYAGARKIYPVITEAIADRLEHELKIITRSGYASLFLIMMDIIQFAHDQDIPTASRGSASSSMVAHCLGITTPDPLRLNLYFERFLNPARAIPPDIDTDICSLRRDEIINYVYQTFGRDRVAMVTTINRFRRRSALREVARVFGLSTQLINELVTSLPYRGWGPTRITELSDDDPYKELAHRFPHDPYPTILEAARFFLGKPHHLSIHPGGIIIAPEIITNFLPTFRAPKGIVVTQFDLTGVQRMGLVKLDLLGIRGLTVLGDMAEFARKQNPLDYPKKLDVLESIPIDDPKTAQLVKEGRTIGCFQIESPGMRATLKEIQADSVDDVMVALALYRPGPMTGGLKDAFIRRCLGLETVTHLHPSLEKTLTETYGVILYQEQVLKIAHELAGLSLEDADLLRRAMSHFDPGHLMQDLKQKFIFGSKEKSNVPRETAEQVWDLIAAFAGYGFPKAHAASYAEIAWRSAWFKAHFPAEFLAAVLANWGGYYSQRVYISEARHLGIKVNPPNINYSDYEFSAIPRNNKIELFMGLNQVRDLTRRTQEQILLNRPFNDIEFFLRKVQPRPKEVLNLAMVDALDEFGNIPSVLRQLKTQKPNRLQMPLFQIDDQQPTDLDWSPEKKAAAQEQVLGISISLHPLELVSDIIKSRGALTTQQALESIGKFIKIAGIRHSSRRTSSISGDAVVYVTVEDLEGNLNVAFTHNRYRLYQQMLTSRLPVLVEGEMSTETTTGEPILIAQKVIPLTK
jgi:DNA polymerase III subunit alpha